jgi:hypothetical protein
VVEDQRVASGAPTVEVLLTADVSGAGVEDAALASLHPWRERTIEQGFGAETETMKEKMNTEEWTCKTKKCMYSGVAFYLCKD